MFLISVKNDRQPARLVTAAASSPVWSPKGDFIVYSGEFHSAQSELHAVWLDAKTPELPLAWETGKKEARKVLKVSPGGYRFLDQMHLIYLDRTESRDFWLFDLDSGERHQITRLTDKGRLRGFDITPDRKHILFDRTLQNSDVVLIDLKRPAK